MVQKIVESSELGTPEPPRSDVGQKQLMLFHIKRPEHAPGVMAHCMLQTVFTHASDR